MPPTFQSGHWVYKPVWFCIYCSNGTITETTKRKLQLEHIIPFGLGGVQLLPRSSCKHCGKETGRIEQDCLRMMLGTTRIRLNLPTRRPEERPATLDLTIVHRDGRTEQRNIPAAEFPLVVPGLKLPPPGILTGQVPHPNNVGEFWMRYPPDEFKKLGTDENQAVRLASFNNWLFARMLAKIAHSFVVAEWGFNSFEPFLLDLILGKTQVAFHWIGGNMQLPPPDPHGLHKIFARREVIGGMEYAIVYLTLFCNFGAPEYQIVVGKWKGG